MNHPPTTPEWERLLNKFEELFPKDQEAVDGVRKSKSNRSAALVLLAEFDRFLSSERKRLSGLVEGALKENTIQLDHGERLTKKHQGFNEGLSKALEIINQETK